MSTHNIGFYEDLTKLIFELSSNTHLISSAVGRMVEGNRDITCLSCVMREPVLADVSKPCFIIRRPVFITFTRRLIKPNSSIVTGYCNNWRRGPNKKGILVIKGG